MPESPPLPVAEASDAGAAVPVGAGAEGAVVPPPAGAAAWLDFFAVGFLEWLCFGFDLAALPFFVDPFFVAPPPAAWEAAPAVAAPLEVTGLLLCVVDELA